MRVKRTASGGSGIAWADVWPTLLLVFTLAGCGEPNANWQPISTDAGSPIFGIGAQNTPILSLAADPQITSLVYIGTDGAGVRRTVADSNGVQNTDTGMNPHSSVFALTPDPAKRGTLYAGTSSGFYVSTDASATWQARNTGLPADNPITAIAAGPNGSPLLAGTKSHGLFLSANQGSTWSAATGGLPSDGQVNAALWVEGVKTALVAFAGGRLYVSHGDLREWTQSATGLPDKSEIQALGISGDGRTLYLGSSQGLYSSGDGGQNWASVGGGLPSAPLARWPAIHISRTPTMPPSKTTCTSRLIAARPGAPSPARWTNRRAPSPSQPTAPGNLSPTPRRTSCIAIRALVVAHLPRPLPRCL